MLSNNGVEFCQNQLFNALIKNFKICNALLSNYEIKLESFIMHDDSLYENFWCCE